jgi:hypothetical protein
VAMERQGACHEAVRKDGFCAHADLLKIGQWSCGLT